MNDVAALGSGASSFADRLVKRLNTWPAVSIGRADCGIGFGLGVGPRQILHLHSADLHSADEAELLLTRPVIERLGAALARSGRVAVRPGGDWVRIGLSTDSDVTLVLSLASVAIKAAGDPVGTSQATPCSAAERPAAEQTAPRPGRDPGPAALSGNGPRRT
ncbi:hypothetical protein SAMN04489712_12324 [Thermomonospora echinospora]|uniref:Luciferase domain-containing protein n=1 Tax=Thermomonospora echinospora TaxID=1992 RepID=A0A1H6DV20_9ACTN|nr:luciferase family protein [Thermomonospora echinospora]SEG89118.1 hypothetical protein SAMN04489712_12324 [Thermomonospora echinospora]